MVIGEAEKVTVSLVKHAEEPTGEPQGATISTEGILPQGGAKKITIH
jgi:hypothetical protein